MMTPEFIRGMRHAASMVEKFAKTSPNAVLICEDIAKEIRRRASLAALRKPRTPKPKAETPAT
jgi:hypothetical protein